MRTCLVPIIGLCLLSTAGRAQLVPEPQYLFEELSWGDKPHDLTWKAGVLWDKEGNTDSVSHFKTGLTNIFELRGRMPFQEKELAVLGEFFLSDSGLGAVMISMGRLSLPFGPDIDSVFFDDDMMDLMWDENVDRFGEPDRSRWIPFVVQSREWVRDTITIRMVRMYNPFEGFVLSYFRHDERTAD